MTEGLLEEEQLENDLVDLLCTDLDKFDSFYEEHKDKITKYFFVFYFYSVNQNNKSFPIVLRKKTNSREDQNIPTDIAEIVSISEDIGMEVIEISFDGDPSYLQYVNNMCTEIHKIKELNITLPLSTIFTECKGILVFEDPLHLVKCDRYRLVCGSLICPLLSSDELFFSIDDLLSIGIKPYVLDPSKAKKNG